MEVMLVRADITCLNCGRFLAQLEGERESSYRNARFIYSPGAREVRQTPLGLRCDYCGGKAIVENLETVRRAA